MRASACLTPLALSALLSVACSYSVPHFGSFPFDGETAVPTDATIVLVAPGSLSKQLPALRDGIRFQDAVTGEALAYELDVDFDAGRVSIRPERPLRADHSYFVHGLDMGMLASSHSWQGGGWRDPAPATVTFYTGSAPELVAAFLVDDELVVAFSEAITDPSAASDVAFFATPLDQVEERVLPTTWIGVHAAGAHLHRYRVDLPEDFAMPSPDRIRVEAAAGLVAEAGGRSAETADLTLGWDGDATLARFTHSSWWY